MAPGLEGLGGLGGLGGFGGGQLQSRVLQARRPPEGRGAKPGTPRSENPRFFPAPKYSFVVQFCWQEKQLTERLRARQEALMNEQEDQIGTGGCRKTPARGNRAARSLLNLETDCHGPSQNHPSCAFQAHLLDRLRRDHAGQHVQLVHRPQRSEDEFDRESGQDQDLVQLGGYAAEKACAPNEHSNVQMDRLLDEALQKVIDAWQTQYSHQETILRWPRELGSDFVNAVRPLKPIELKVEFPTPQPQELKVDFRQRYANYVERLLPKLAV
jgi:hypothetical protein